MLPPKNRLKAERDFERIFRNGKAVSGQFLVLKTAPNGKDFSRFGFVVSQKISKKATIRNKIKRRLREAVRMLLAKVKSGFDVVFFTRKGIEEKGFLEIKESLEELFEKAGLIIK